jgi:hypothetical protein
MIIFSLILASEAAMREIIGRNLASVWFDELRPAARAEVDEVYAIRLKTNTQVTKLDCVMTHDLLALLQKCPGLWISSASRRIGIGNGKSSYVTFAIRWPTAVVSSTLSRIR